MRWLAHWNENAQPFHWTKSAAAIKRSLDNVGAIYETRHLKAIQEAGVFERVHFAQATAKDFPGTYELIAFFDCLHDLGDPVGAARHRQNATRHGRNLDDR